jgi:hypothetical protein
VEKQHFPNFSDCDRLVAPGMPGVVALPEVWKRRTPIIWLNRARRKGGYGGLEEDLLILREI